MTVLRQNSPMRMLDSCRPSYYAQTAGSIGWTAVGPWSGLLDHMTYAEECVPTWIPGDILIAYSDGVTEPENDFR